MYQNQQYDFDWGPDGPLAPLYARLATPEYMGMIDPPVGWLPLVLKLNDNLSSILPAYTIAQVKEKFAGLRYSIDSFGVALDDPRVALAKELITEAEQASTRICQVCGQPGQQRKDITWHATLCDEHAS
mgnify:CR=1 FL=1